MATLTLKNLPTRLHDKLKKRAVRHRRSLNREVISCLEASLESQKVDVDEFLVKARKLRGEVKGKLKDQDLLHLKNSGRP